MSISSEGSAKKGDIIAHPATGIQPADWQTALAQGIADAAELLRILAIEPESLDAPFLAGSPFRVKVPLAFVGRMRRGDPHDPLLRQVLPIASELDSAPGFVADPVGDEAAEVVPGVLRKYRGRVLLIASGACAIHCRYCFRRHFSYGDSLASRERWQSALGYLREDTSIGEVILSGGDPLSLSDSKLERLVIALDEIPHLKRLRIHTRLPIVLPARVDSRLTGWLKRSRLRTIVVLHANHRNEIDSDVGLACTRLCESGATVLNQSVLLAGINDSVDALSTLSEALFENGVLPYYLHLLDPVAGAAHFQVAEHAGRNLVRQLRERLPGYLVPQLVREQFGEPYKTPLF